MPIHITDETFESEVLKSNIPVLVDFWAEWCGPCLKMAPILDQISEEQAGKLTIAKLNVDENPERTSGEHGFGVQSIPTMILFVNGQPVEELVGLMPKEAVMAKLATHLQ